MLGNAKVGPKAVKLGSKHNLLYRFNPCKATGHNTRNGIF
jgi:hypothetical protein